MSFETQRQPRHALGRSIVPLGFSAEGNSDLALEVHRLSKVYRLYRRPQDRLWQALSLGRQRYYHEVHALHNVSFSVPRGRTVGIIGANGSGKSTLLQVIAGTVTPTAGLVRISGRVAALLELGSGFNPEFSGRDNVYMYASLLGLTPEEIRDRFDAIASFADIGDFIDCPLKTYSSGMLVRLAFAVAINVDPEILLVDEALAVGDIRFQQRCMTRIRQLRDQGVTILFVTHDLEAAKRLCDQVHVLERGRLIRSGHAADVANWYLARISQPESAGDRCTASAITSKASHPSTDLNNADSDAAFRFFRHGDGRGQIRRVEITGADGRPAETVRMDEEVTFRFELEFRAAVGSPVLGFYVRDRLGTDVIGINTFEEGTDLPAVQPGDRMTVEFTLPLRLRPGHYSVSPGLSYNRDEMRYLDWQDNALVFRVVDPRPGRTVFGLTHPPVRVAILPLGTTKPTDALMADAAAPA